MEVKEMDKDKKQYIHFNPTQINNYGSGENSAQTISRKIKEKIDNPMDTVDQVVGGLNWLWSLLFKSIPYFILTIVLPLAVCGGLGFVLLYCATATSPNTSHFITGISSSITEVISLIPEVLSISLPLIIIFGCGILGILLFSLIVAYVLYPEDSVARRKCFTALFGAQLGIFLYKTIKSR